MPTFCIENNCTKRPTYNNVGEKQRLYCNIHKKEGMINVKDLRCITPGCDKLAVFNINGEVYGLYCVTHKKNNMIDVKNRKCLEPGCKITPNYNKDNTSGLYCNIHKKEGMINVNKKRCIAPQCQICPLFNIKGSKTAIYCATHKLPEMIDIKNRKCITADCNKTPVYNNIGEKRGLYCNLHKIHGMINVKDKKCIEPECCKIPNYNNKGEKLGLYCLDHKKEGMIDVKHLKCKSSWCEILANKKYNGYCLNCFIHLFPDEPNSLNYKTKEKATSEYILEQFPIEKYTWVIDKKIQNGCSKKRPDLLLDLGYQVIILEIDENQHQDYDCSCENKRLMLLSQDVGHRPIIFIRFNPDDYITKDGKITSCWGINGRGIYIVKKTKQKEWRERLEALKIQLEYWLDPKNKTDKTIEVVQLFYNTN